jgi:serine/threonine-protein kinase RsbW
VAPGLQPSAPALYHADFEATFKEVSRVCSEVHALALERGNIEWAVLVDLGLTEAMTNVIRHGYASAQHGRVTLTCIETVDQWQLTLKDCGTPIPQAQLHQADGSIFDFDPDDLRSIPEGGMGLALIRACFDTVDYQAHRDGNCLQLTKRLDPAAT